MILHHLFLPLLLYMDFGGTPLYDFRTENCFISQLNCQLTRFNKVYHIGEFDDEEVKAIKAKFAMTPFTWVIEANDHKAENILKIYGFTKYPELFSVMRVNIKNFADNIYQPYITVKEINQKDDIEKLIDLISRSHSGSFDSINN